MPEKQKEHSIMHEQEFLKACENAEKLAESITLTDEDIAKGVPYYTKKVTERTMAQRNPQTGEMEIIPKEQGEREAKVTVTRHPRVLLKLGRKFYDPNTHLRIDDYADLHTAGTDGIMLYDPERRPKPLISAVKRPEFPIASLPAPFADYAAQLAEDIQVPVDMVGTSVLAVLAGCLQGHYQVKAKEKYVEPVNLYIQVIAQPGERKSPIFEEVVRPIKDIQEKCLKDYAKQEEDDAVDLRAARKRLKKAEDAYEAGMDDPNAEELRAEVKKWQARIAAIEARKPPTYFMDNTTTEALAQETARNNGRMIVMSDEGDLINILSGVYSSGMKMIDMVLKGHTGGSVRIDRKNSPTIRIPKAYITLLLMVQPYIVDKIMADEELRSRGLNARFLYCMPKTRVGNRNTAEAKPIDPLVDAAYYNTVRSLFQAHVEDVAEPAVLTMTERAQEQFFIYEAGIEKRLKGDLQNLQDWGNKLSGALLRIAGILHVVKHRETAVHVPIETETIDAAYALAMYFCEYARMVFNVNGMDLKFQTCVKILQAIQKDTMNGFSLYEFHRTHRMGFDKWEDMEVYMNILEDYGYVSGSEVGTTRSTYRYTVHPLVFEEEAIWEEPKEE